LFGAICYTIYRQKGEETLEKSLLFSSPKLEKKQKYIENERLT
jgi:hypothetical protein